MARAESCLSDLAPSTDRVGTSDLALRQVGQLKNNLAYRSAADILANLTDEMNLLQDGINEISDSIRARYFPVSALPQWIGEVS